MVHYFAYGSNMDEAQMKERMTSEKGRCSNFPKGTFRIVGSGFLPNHQLKFNKIPNKPNHSDEGYANVSSPGQGVEGIVYEIDESGKDRLNCFEGVENGDYNVEERSIVTKDGALECVLYIAHLKINDKLKPKKSIWRIS